MNLSRRSHHLAQSLPPIMAVFLAATSLAGPSGLQTSLFSVPALGDVQRIPLERVSFYRLSSSDEAFTLPDTPFQRVKNRDAGKDGARITLASGEAGATPSPSRADLEDTPLLTMDDPAVRSLAARARRMGEPVSSVVRLVHAHISDKRAGIPIIPAREIALGRAGDCTEHTVLAVALLRSLGVPARALVGMVYCESFEGVRNVFVFHMWAEAYSGGRWVLVDATRPGGEGSNRYVAFAFHHLKTAAPLSYLRAVAAIQNLQVERIP